MDIYLDFINKRASGEILTGAAWMRNFVMNHPAYKHDSIVSQEIAYDMLYKLVQVWFVYWSDAQISTGQIQDKTLLGDVIISNTIEEDLTPCCDRAVLIGKVFKAPVKRFSVFDLVAEALAHHALEV